MNTVDKIMKKEVITGLKSQSIYDIAKLMREKHVGDVVIVEKIKSQVLPIGILTDRDIVTSVVADHIDPLRVQARDVMSKTLVTARPEESLSMVLETMSRTGIRRIPIVSSDMTLLGIISFEDILSEVSRILTRATEISKKEVQIERVMHPLSPSPQAAEPHAAFT